MHTEPHSFPSGFYLLLEDAANVVLEFPVDDDSGGPFWSDDGQLDLVRCKEWDQEEVGVVPLGGNRYRLAERQMGPFSRRRLYWGDEFNAGKGVDGTLRLTSRYAYPVRMPISAFLPQAGSATITCLSDTYITDL